jgi:hypothetical protein
LWFKSCSKKNQLRKKIKLSAKDGKEETKRETMAKAERCKTKNLKEIIMTAKKVIGFTEFFGKVNAIVVKNEEIELEETKIQRSDCCWKD